jgi:hypothetical protein
MEEHTFVGASGREYTFEIIPVADVIEKGRGNDFDVLVMAVKKTGDHFEPLAMAYTATEYSAFFNGEHGDYVRWLGCTHAAVMNHAGREGPYLIRDDIRNAYQIPKIPNAWGNWDGLPSQ